MIDVRDNARVLLLVVLCVLAGLALFGPFGASGESPGSAEPPVPESIATATTDDGGGYGIELPVGEYDVVIDATGYDRFADTLEVTAGDTTGFDISLEERATGTVSGTVTGPNGSVSGAEVRFVDNATGERAQVVETDGSGAYEATLETGGYTARVDAVGFGPFETGFQVEDGDQISRDISLDVEPTGTVAGVITAGGEPAADVAVEIVDSATGTAVTTATTDANGTYEATVETGEVSVQVTDPRFGAFRAEQFVPGDETTVLDITLDVRETGTLTGVVTAGGDPVADAEVTVSDPETGEPQAQTRTGQDGGYEFELAATSYNVSVDELLFAAVEEQVSLDANATEQLDITLDRRETGTVEGAVTAGGDPVTGVDVRFVDPESGLGESLRANSVGDPTNLQYGLELSGGARIRGQMVGLTAEAVGIDQSNRSAFSIASVVAEELGLDSIDVRARTSADAVEVYTQDVTRGEFADALGAAGLDVGESDIRQGVTGETRTEAVSTLTDRVDQTGLSGANVFTSSAVTGENFVVAEVPGITRAELREIISDTGRVQIIAGFPETTENGTRVYNQTELATQESIVGVDSAQRGTSQIPSPHVPVTLSEDAGQRFADVLQNAGFTSQGVGNCFFDAEVYDAPAQTHQDQYCLFTVVDGEYVYGSSLAPGLADTIESGRFANDPSFVMQTGSFDEAEQLEVNLRAGELPTDIDIVTESFISPSLAQLFKPLALLTALMAWLAVSAIVYYWYRDIRIAVPMLITASSEVFLLLGFASVIGLAIDLSHIAGFIAVIGTGLDDLIIMADEILQRKQKVQTGRVFKSRFRKAFWVIGMAAATTIIAMSPLAVLSLGDLQGFAIVTIVGVIIGVGITRPAYGDVLRKLMLDDVKRTG